MTKKLLSLALGGLLLSQAPVVLRAGGFLETIDITGNEPSPIPGQLIARLIPIRWDVRSIPVKFQVNNTLDPIPNPLPGGAFLTVAQVTIELQASLDAWNKIPTSYIQMQIEGTTNNPGVRRFDFRNELTFRTASTFAAIASSPSTSLIEDATFDDGDDIDGDGDSDVSGAITVAADVDNDGDIEFPAGFYKAGTILDNDVQFNTKTSNGLRFTINTADIDIVTRSVDLAGVATHEFGHSLGLSHSMDNQLSAADGNGATMFPFIDTGDPASEFSERTLEIDDIAWASLHYPEGTSKWGVAALQAGDVAYSKVYGLITGNVQHGVLDQPVAGASAYAMDKDDRVVASGFSGTTQVSFNPVTGALNLISPAFNILDGVYKIPVPKGNYSVGIEAVDGQPVASGSISLTAQIGDIFGQLNFTEEFYNKNKEDAVEIRPGQERNIRVTPGRVNDGIDITTAKNLNINNFGSRDFIGFTGSPAGRIYAVRIPASQVTAAAALAGGRLVLQSALFDTVVVDASVAPQFAEAMLTTGTASADGATVALDLVDPLDRVEGFLGQDGDMATFFFKNGRLLGRRVLRGIADGSITNLFIVLRLPTSTPFPGVSAIPPLIGLDGGVTPNDVPIFGLSYISDNGGATFTRSATFNFRFSLGVSELP